MSPRTCVRFETWRRAIVASLFLMLSALSAPAWAQGGDEAAPGAEGGEAADGAEPEGGEATGESGEAAEGGEAAAPKGPKPKVLILPTQSVEGKLTPLVPERVGATTRERLREDGEVVLMPSFTEIRKQLAGQGQSSAVIYEAEQLYNSGIGLITAGENEQALESFKRAVELMEQNLADVQSYDILADALANLALAYYASGYDLDGRKRMKQFAHMRPEATLNPEKYPKELLKVLTEEQAKIKKAGPGKLIVKANVEAATIMVDGVDKGAAPATIEDVGFGYHYVVVRGAAGGVWAKQIRVRGRGKEQAIEVTVEASGGAVAAGDGGEQMPTYYVDLNEQIKKGAFDADELQPYLSELAKQSGAPFIGWVLVYKDGMKYVAAPFVWRAEDGRLVQVKQTEFNFELSDLALGVNRMSGDIAAAILEMPEDEAVTQVALIAPPRPVVKDPAPDTSGGVEQSSGGGETSPVVIARPDETRGADPVPQPLDPPPVPEDERDRKKTWRYVGYGTAAAVVVGGLVAGSLVLFSASGAPTPNNPDGFSAEVSW